MEKKLFERILKGVLASFYGQGVTLAFQFLSVPIFISNWGVEKYGEWVLLFAIPSSIAMLELGFFSIIGNKISIFLEKEDYKEASSIVNTISLFFLALILIVIFFQVIFSIISDAVLVLIYYSILFLWSNFTVSVFRADRMFHVGSFVSTTARLFESIIAIVVIYLGYDIYQVALTYLYCRFISVLSIYFYMNFKLSWYNKLSFNKGSISTTDLKNTFNYSLMPLGFLINNQVIIFLINYLFGSATLALFSVLRTYFRVINQFVTAITNSSWQEVNFFCNRYEYDKSFSLLYKISKLTTILIVVISVLFYSISDSVLNFWTKGTIIAPESIKIAMLLSVALFSFWQPFHMFLGASNNYKVHSKIYLLLQLVGISFLYVFSPTLESSIYFITFLELVMIVSILFVTFAFKSKLLRINHEI